MPDFNEVQKAIMARRDANGFPDANLVRRKYLNELAQYTGRPCIAYYSGWQHISVDGVGIDVNDMNAFMLCVKGIERDKGLDLLLHTPGGDVMATERIIRYLKELFGNDIRAIVPHLAMSGGTVIACSCKSIVMGKHSSLGPTDPTIGRIPAFALHKEFERMTKDILKNEKMALVWRPIMEQLPPAFLQQCEYAMEKVGLLVRELLECNMFAGDNDKAKKADVAAGKLNDLETNKGHDKQFTPDECAAMGLKIESLEDDQTFQDKVLSVHHAYENSFGFSPTLLKITENHKGIARARHALQR